MPRTSLSWLRGSIADSLTPDAAGADGWRPSLDAVKVQVIAATPCVTQAVNSI